MFIRPKEDWIAILIVGFMAFLAAWCCDLAQAAEIPQDKAVNAILGEALHDDDSMLVMAHALRNRGHLGGVYGARVIRPYSDKLRAKALKAWKMSLSGDDPTRGADHWLSDYDLKHCRPERMAWRFKMVETLHQGQTHYFKGVK